MRHYKYAAQSSPQLWDRSDRKIDECRCSFGTFRWWQFGEIYHLAININSSKLWVTSLLDAWWLYQSVCEEKFCLCSKSPFFTLQNRNYLYSVITNKSMDFTKVLIVHHKWSFASTITIESIFQRLSAVLWFLELVLGFNPMKDDFDLHCDSEERKTFLDDFFQETHCCCCCFLFVYTQL